MSTAPLLPQYYQRNESIEPLLKQSKCDKVRNYSSICYPLALLFIIGGCILGLYRPFAAQISSILISIPHSFISLDGRPSFHSMNKAFITEQALDDLVDALPGLTTELDFAHYSGYVEALEGRQIHYWFFEAQSNADTAPLFFWTNGGPGCSGLCGLLTEHGPFWATADGNLMINEFSWNKEVNIVYFEQPFGVGFSSVDAENGQAAVTGDAQAVADFDAAIRSFIEKFPIFTDRDVYLSSESFGGHYMPLTALQIMQNNEQLTDGENVVNLKGFMVGNPYTNYYENTMGAMEAFYGHGLMRNDIYETWQEYCFGDEQSMDDTHCRYLYMIGYYEADNTDHYALDFNDCEGDVSWNKHGKHLLFRSKFISKTIDKLLAQFKSDDEWQSYTDDNIRPMIGGHRGKHNKNNKLPTRKEIVSFKNKMNGHNKIKKRRLNVEWAYDDAPYFECAADFMTSYLNNEMVQSALNVKKGDWTMCADDVFSGWPEQDWDNKMEPYYAQLAAKYPNLKILIFSGDDDSVCGLHGTQYWLDNMDEYGWKVDAENEWIPWQIDNQLGGYSTTYLTENGDVALYFHTVRTAGHMVPQTQPKRALGLLNKFLSQMD